MNKSAFTQTKQNLELKLVLMHTLEDFDPTLASLLNDTIEHLSDKDVVELIIHLRDVKDDQAIISAVLNTLTKKTATLTSEIERVYGKSFIEQYLNK